jgi:hypothetical protein
MRWLGLALVVACSSRTASPPTNTVPAPARLAIPADADLGVLGFAPGTGDDWLPKADGGLFVSAGDHRFATHRAIDRSGKTLTLTGTRDASLAFGCDNNAISVTELGTGARFAPGLVWILPASSAWTPVALPIAATASAERRLERAGPITVETVRVAPALARMTLAWNGRVVHTREVVRGDMAGAPTTPIDLSTGDPGVPHLAAAWQIGGERGVVLAAFHAASYEGEQVWAAVLDEERGREVEALGFYLYRCAF